MLSHCAAIIGPPSSSFSRLAANLGSRPATRADELLEAGTELQVLRRGISVHLDAATVGTTFWNGLVARDICWCLDVFPDELPIAEQVGLAATAVKLEPDFAGALAQWRASQSWPGIRARASMRRRGRADLRIRHPSSRSAPRSAGH